MLPCSPVVVRLNHNLPFFLRDDLINPRQKLFLLCSHLRQFVVQIRQTDLSIHIFILHQLRLLCTSFVRYCLKSTFLLYVLLYHLICNFLFRLILFCPFSYIINGHLAFALAKFHFHVDMSIWLVVGKQYTRLHATYPPETYPPPRRCQRGRQPPLNAVNSTSMWLGHRTHRPHATVPDEALAFYSFHMRIVARALLYFNPPAWKLCSPMTCRGGRVQLYLLIAVVGLSRSRRQRGFYLFSRLSTIQVCDFCYADKIFPYFFPYYSSIR